MAGTLARTTAAITKLLSSDCAYTQRNTAYEELQDRLENCLRMLLQQSANAFIDVVFPRANELEDGLRAVLRMLVTKGEKDKKERKKPHAGAHARHCACAG